MTTLMASNLKLLSDASSETVDATMYRWLGPWCTRDQIFAFAMKTFDTCSPNGWKECRGTTDYGLKYDANQKINLEGYVDSDWASSAIDRKSTLGCCFSMGSGVISWFNRKQSCVALSTSEAEYVVAYSASCEVIWLTKVLSNLSDLQLDATCIYCDN